MCSLQAPCRSLLHHHLANHSRSNAALVCQAQTISQFFGPFSSFRCVSCLFSGAGRRLMIASLISHLVGLGSFGLTQSEQGGGEANGGRRFEYRPREVSEGVSFGKGADLMFRRSRGRGHQQPNRGKGRGTKRNQSPKEELN
eukprot:c16510_g1_i7.p1 GENE.c16510_g1_i7~~c16510_g1_i7.p1  ORF type:complete len:142 (+),score=12.99 c16510_g1_i7:1-426(+)